MSPTGRTALAIAVCAALAFALPWWAVAGAVLVVAAATVADASMLRRPVEVERTLPKVLARGVPARLELAAGPAPGRLRLRQPATPDILIAEQEGADSLRTTIVGRRRGRHLLPAAFSRSVGPLGLAARSRPAGDDAQILVYPDLPAARRLAVAVRRGRFRYEGRARGPIGLGTDFESVREYQPDDDIRHVNWRATERLGRPMSNQYRVERDRDVVCVVDCGRLMGAPLRDRTRLDAAVDAAVAIAAVADALSDRCGAVAFDERVRRFVPPRRAGSDAVVQALFDVEPSPADADYDRAFAAVGAAKRAFVLVFTDLLDESAARPLLDALPSLARRHAVVVVSSADDDLRLLVTREPEERVEVYRAAVALDVLAVRAAVVATLRRHGVGVVEAPAEHLAAASVRAYLRAKARVLV